MKMFDWPLRRVFYRPVTEKRLRQTLKTSTLQCTEEESSGRVVSVPDVGMVKISNSAGSFLDARFTRSLKCHLYFTGLAATEKITPLLICF
jgi:hypothetical protein